MGVNYEVRRSERVRRPIVNRLAGRLVFRHRNHEWPKAQVGDVKRMVGGSWTNEP